MAQETDYKHQFLDLKDDGMDDHSFLGQTHLSTRSSLFVMLAAVIAAVLGAVYFYVDQRIATAINELRHAGDVRILVDRVVHGLARVEKLEKTLILKNTPENHETFSDAIGNIEMALDNLRGGTTDVVLSEPMATLRDGIVQYNQQILDFIRSRKEIGEIANERRHFDEIMSYIAPSLDFMRDYSANLWTKSAERIDQNIAFSRYTIGGASIAILLWLIFWATLLLRSIASPVTALADTAIRLTNGDRSTPIPVRGNTDASGQIARSFEKWAQDLANLELLRRELHELQLGIEQKVRSADDQTQTSVETVKGTTKVKLDTLETARESEISGDTALTLGTKEELPPSVSVPDYVYGGSSVGGPISSVSQQLSHFSEYVSAAAYDVERMEALVRLLGDAASNIEDIGNLVAAVRDQVNSLGFRLSPRGERPEDSENLISFNSGEHQLVGGNHDSEAADRLDTLRETTERAERTLQGVKLAVDNISAMAQEMTITASRQAVEATNKLLAQSQYLQSMLDDIMTRIDPSKLDRQSSPELRHGHSLPPKRT